MSQYLQEDGKTRYQYQEDSGVDRDLLATSMEDAMEQARTLLAEGIGTHLADVRQRGRTVTFPFDVVADVVPELADGGLASGERKRVKVTVSDWPA
jgi:hypothetical protein